MAEKSIQRRFLSSQRVTANSQWQQCRLLFYFIAIRSTCTPMKTLSTTKTDVSLSYQATEIQGTTQIFFCFFIYLFQNSYVLVQYAVFMRHIHWRILCDSFVGCLGLIRFDPKTIFVGTDINR